MNHQPSIAVIYAATVLLSLIAAPRPVAAADFPAIVIDVTAGDIYQVENNGKKQMVVLYGVFAPPNPAAARQARDAGIQKALGKQVTVRVVERRPGMTVVELTLPDGTNLSHSLLREGFLRWDSLTADDDQGLRDLELLAKQDRVGVWSSPTSADEAPTANAGPVVQNERQFQRRLRADYDILEGRAYTDANGVPTLVLRGNGRKIVGFEKAAEQQRIDELTAAAQEAEWAAMEAALAEAEAAEQAAAEEQRLLDEAAARDAQNQNLQMLNDYVFFGRTRGMTVTTIPLSPY